MLDLIVTGGTYTIPADPTANGTASLAVSVGGGSSPASVIFAGNSAGTHGIDPYHLASLNISSNGSASLAPAASGLDSDRTLLTTNSLSITGGSLDITSNSIDVHYLGSADPIAWSCPTRGSRWPDRGSSPSSIAGACRNWPGWSGRRRFFRRR